MHLLPLTLLLPPTSPMHWHTPWSSATTWEHARYKWDFEQDYDPIDLEKTSWNGMRGNATHFLYITNEWKFKWQTNHRCTGYRKLLTAVCIGTKPMAQYLVKYISIGETDYTFLTKSWWKPMTDFNRICHKAVYMSSTILLQSDQIFWNHQLRHHNDDTPAQPGVQQPFTLNIFKGNCHHICNKYTE